MNESLKDRLLQTDRLYETISKILAAGAHDGAARPRLVASLCAIALEHGYSIRALLEVNHVTSAIALLRTQFEAVVRALWMNFAASEGWVAKCDGLIESGSLKELSAPTMDDMLAAIAAAAPESIGRMLNGLKEGAWKPLNSYIHSGIHPVMQQHRGYPPEYALQTLRNANGLATMAAMLMAVMSGESRVTDAIRQAQLDHLDCLPPLAV